VIARHAVALGLTALIAVLFGVNLFGSQVNQLLLALPGIDKILHLVFFAILFPGLRAVTGRFVTNSATQTMVAGVAGVLIALSDELVQSFSPYRSVEVADLIADTSGLAIGWTLSARPRRALAIPVATIALAAALIVAYLTNRQLADYAQALRYEHQQDFARARESYLRALNNGMRSADLYNGLAWVQVESGLGEPAKAVEYAQAALAMRPNDPDVLDTYGWALQHAGRSQEALPYLERAYAAKPQMYCIHYHLGMTYLAVGRRELAEKHLRSQLERPDTREFEFARKALATIDHGQ
jgi:tetratricopeptide (TPR) repeat protein